MNDPRVKTLHYRVVVGKDVDYNGAEPLHQITDDFEFRLDGNTALFEMKKHYSTEHEARETAEQYLQAWYILIGLEYDPEELRLGYDHADIIDRSPKKSDGNIVNLHAHISDHVVASDSVPNHVSRGKYPSLPKNFSTSIDAETIYFRYKSYRQNRETLNSMAYMCLTVFAVSAGNRKKAGQQYNIDYEVIETLGKLSSTKGSHGEARKFPQDGTFKPLSSKEREWIIQVIKAIIRRQGEYAYGHKVKLNQITMKDFPELP